MSTMRRLLISLLILALLLPVSALASVKSSKDTANPTVRITAKKPVVHPGVLFGFDVRFNVPGYVTASVLHEDGSVLITFAQGQEISSGNVAVYWDGLTEDGAYAPEGKYTLQVTLTDEWGDVSKPAELGFTVGAPTPQISDLQFDSNGRGNWVFDMELSQEGTLTTELYTANDLEEARYTIDKAEYPQGHATVQWDGVLEAASKEEGDAQIYGGRYAVIIKLTNEDKITGQTEPLFITVDSESRPFLTEKGSPWAVSTPASTGGTSAQSTGGTAQQPSGGDEEEGAGTSAGDPGDEDPDAASAGQGAASSASGTQTVSLVIPQAADVGVGVSDVADQPEDNYWNLSRREMTDEAIWAAMMQPANVVNISESDHFYLLDEPDNYGRRLGEFHGTNASINLLYEDAGWTLAEGFRNEDGAFVRGWVRTARIKEVKPDATYGVLIDKATQTLTVYKEGEKLGTIKVSTGLAIDASPVRETPAGEYLLGTRIGKKDQAGVGTCDYHIRINGGILIHGEPYTVKGGEKDYSEWATKLGTESTRNTIVVQSVPDAGSELCMQWLWDNLKANTKILILDDKDRSVIPFVN